MTARFIVLYGTPADPAAFDRYYRDVHIPLSHHLPGLRSYTVARDASPVRGGDPYYLIGELEWDTMADLRAAFASPKARRPPPTRPSWRKWPHAQHGLHTNRDPPGT